MSKETSSKPNKRGFRQRRRGKSQQQPHQPRTFNKINQQNSSSIEVTSPSTGESTPDIIEQEFQNDLDYLLTNEEKDSQHSHFENETVFIPTGKFSEIQIGVKEDDNTEPKNISRRTRGKRDKNFTVADIVEDLGDLDFSSDGEEFVEIDTVIVEGEIVVEAKDHESKKKRSRNRNRNRNRTDLDEFLGRPRPEKETISKGVSSNEAKSDAIPSQNSASEESTKPRRSRNKNRNRSTRSRNRELDSTTAGPNHRTEEKPETEIPQENEKSQETEAEQIARAERAKLIKKLGKQEWSKARISKAKEVANLETNQAELLGENKPREHESNDQSTKKTRRSRQRLPKSDDAANTPRQGLPKEANEFFNSDGKNSEKPNSNVSSTTTPSPIAEKNSKYKPHQTSENQNTNFVMEKIGQKDQEEEDLQKQKKKQANSDHHQVKSEDQEDQEDQDQIQKNQRLPTPPQTSHKSPTDSSTTQRFGITLKSTSNSNKLDHLPKIQPIKTIIGVSHSQILKSDLNDVKIKTIMNSLSTSKYINNVKNFVIKYQNDPIFTTYNNQFILLCINISLYESNGINKTMEVFPSIVDLLSNYQELNLETTKTTITKSERLLHQNNLDYLVLGFFGHILIWAYVLQINNGQNETFINQLDLQDYINLSTIKLKIGGNHLWDKLNKTNLMNSKRWKHLIKFRNNFPFEEDQFLIVLRFLKINNIP
ncbi:hypothetical protein KGF54_002920 [Candida jiufengensis]|uniref:uncharacterized protein n=1 Tax=Candida jiufengensis TaxID=497108 RepID=UPI002224C713|nr:uncharacterized protein KGF54_002920 [Candida jiufengensis]KAI5953548.1 hypothetical protein KGF54_002920 [Candida jiufengensis]